MYRVNRRHPLNQGKVNWWMVQPDGLGGSTLFDLMGNSNGTLTGYTSGNGWVHAARPGGFASLKGTTTAGYVNIGASDNKIPTSTTRFAIGGWVRFNSFNSNYSNLLFRGNASGGYYGILISPGGLWIGHVGTTGPSGNTLSTGRWYHLTVTYDGTSALLYQDGVFVSSNPTTPLTNIVTYQIGNELPNNRFLDGWYDDIFTYNRLLSATEVRALYDQSRRGHPDTLLRIRPPFYAAASVGGSSFSPHLLPDWQAGYQDFTGGYIG